MSRDGHVGVRCDGDGGVGVEGVGESLQDGQGGDGPAGFGAGDGGYCPVVAAGE